MASLVAEAGYPVPTAGHPSLEHGEAEAAAVDARVGILQVGMGAWEGMSSSRKITCKASGGNTLWAGPEWPESVRNWKRE